MTPSRGAAGPWRARRRAPLLWALAVLVSSSWPRPGLPPQVTRGDKLFHAFLFAVLAWLVARAEPRATASVRGFVVTLGALLAFAAFDEWHQRFIPGRSAGMDDWVADAVGAAGALLLAAARRRAPAAA